MWDLGVILLSLGLLMYTAYRGFFSNSYGTDLCPVSGFTD